MLAQKQDNPAYCQRGKQEVHTRVLGAVPVGVAILP